MSKINPQSATDTRNYFMNEIMPNIFPYWAHNQVYIGFDLVQNDNKTLKKIRIQVNNTGVNVIQESSTKFYMEVDSTDGPMKMAKMFTPDLTVLLIMIRDLTMGHWNTMFNMIKIDE